MKVIVTGGADGIGGAIVAAFQGEAARVGVVDLVKASEADCSVRADAGAPDELEAAIEELLGALGGVDVLVNNVGIAGATGGVETVTHADMRRTFDVNVVGASLATARCVPHMTSGASIINIVSTAGIFGYPNRTPYVASKWAMVGLTKTWAMELGERGIRVNAICPGSIDSPRMDRVIAAEAEATGRTEDDVRAGYLAQTSMQTFVTGEDIAQMAVFLANAPKITGQIISVDGHAETLRT